MVLSLNNVSKSYGSNKALDHFSAVMEPGIYALLGPNGSGKTTLMNILTDNLKADSGEITYTDASGNTENVLHMGARFREKLGFMPQYPGLYPNFSVERFMWYMAALKGLGKNAAKTYIPKILSEVGLDDVTGRKIGALSGGMKQRLALAQAMLGDPEVLTLDEPTAGLDPKQRIAIRSYISRVAFNKIVIIATHVVSDIEYIARDVIFLKKGVIVENASPRELVKKAEGKVWNVICGEDEAAELQNRFRVMNIARADVTGNILLRVLSDVKPAENAAAAAPTLEDYYLYVFGEQNLRN